MLTEFSINRKGKGAKRGIQRAWFWSYPAAVIVVSKLKLLIAGTFDATDRLRAVFRTPLG